MKMKNRNHRNRDGQQPANVPPLFDPDLKRNLAAWVQKCFPDTPTMQPDEAIRLWLGKGVRDRPPASAGTPVCDTAPQRPPGQGGIDNHVDGHRSDDQLAATLRRIAEMVSAALYNEQQQRREPEDVTVRHPIHWSDADQVRRISAVDFMERTADVRSTGVRFGDIGQSAGNYGGNEADFPHTVPIGSKGHVPDGYASPPPGAKSNGRGLHRPDLEQSQEIGHSTGNGNNGKNVTFRPAR
jgi:hypothetical protein